MNLSLAAESESRKVWEAPHECASCRTGTVLANSRGEINAGKVLIVDDEDSIRFLVMKVLERRGFIVESARDGVEAIEKIEAGQFDAMVLDVMMPRVDGFAVYDHLVQSNSSLSGRTVVLTAYPQTALSRFKKTCQVLAKPFDLQHLLDAVTSCAGLDRARSTAFSS